MDSGTGRERRQCRPQDGREQHQRQAEMDHQPVGRDRGALGKEARFHHEPADGGLQDAQAEQAQQPGHHPPLDRAGQGEPQQRQQEHHAHQPAPGAMRPFQPEDLPEAGQIHAGVQQRVLRNCLILVEQAHPLGVGEGWQRARERRPFHDRQAGAGQARGPAEQYHAPDHIGDREQPQCHAPAIAAEGRRLGTWKGAIVKGHGLQLSPERPNGKRVSPGAWSPQRAKNKSKAGWTEPVPQTPRHL